MDDKHLGLLAAATAAFFFGIGNPFAKIALNGTHPLAMEIYASVFAGLLLLAISVAYNRKLPPVSIRDLKDYLGIGILGFGIPAALTLYALTFTTAINVIVILRAEIFFGTIFGVVLFKEKIDLTHVVGIIAGFIGVFIFVTGFSLTGVNIGDLLVLVATFFWSVYLIFARRLTNKLDSITIASLRYLFALVLLIPAAFLLDVPLSFSPSQLGNFATFVLSTYVLGLIAYNYSIRKIGIWRAAVPTQLLTVLFGAAVTWLVLGENLSNTELLGAALIIVGTLLSIGQKDGKPLNS